MNFFLEFLKNKKQIGSMIPSSRFLAKSTTSKIDYSSARVIVELGGGTGIFTEELVKNLSENTLLFIFEINPTLYNILRNKFTKKMSI